MRQVMQPCSSKNRSKRVSTPALVADTENLHEILANIAQTLSTPAPLSPAKGSHPKTHSPVVPPKSCFPSPEETQGLLPEHDAPRRKPSKKAEQAYVTHPESFSVITPEVFSESDEDKTEISASITQTWTDQAIRCYVTKADCSICTIPKGNYSFTCKMNQVVDVLLDSLGEPDENRVTRIRQTELI